jgi:hypothetical protein
MTTSCFLHEPTYPRPNPFEDDYELFHHESHDTYEETVETSPIHEQTQPTHPEITILGQRCYHHARH